MEEDLKVLDDIRYKVEQKISNVRQLLERLIEFYDMESLKKALSNLVDAEHEISVELDTFTKKKID